MIQTKRAIKSTKSIKPMKRRSRKHKIWRNLQRICLLAILTAATAIAFRTAASSLLAILPGQGGQQIIETTKQPITRETSQVSKDLKAYAAVNAAAADIYKNRAQYPKALLAAYLNNPEMESFVTDYLNADPSKSGELSSAELGQDFPLLLQWDKRWGYVSYGESMIGLSGCGPTCLSMALVALTGDAAQTPARVAQFSESNGYYVTGSGTSWSLMTDGAAKLGLSVRELPLDESVMKQALDNGEPIICSMGPGDFTTQGHFILIRGYDAQGFLVNDPNCMARSNQPWSYDRLAGQIKNLWAYQAY